MDVDAFVNSVVSDQVGALSSEAVVVSLLVSLSIPEADARLYAPTLMEHGFENAGLLSHIEKEDLELMPVIKKIAHKKAILKWAAAYSQVPLAAAAAAAAKSNGLATTAAPPENGRTSTASSSASPAMEAKVPNSQSKPPETVKVEPQGAKVEQTTKAEGATTTGKQQQSAAKVEQKTVPDADVEPPPPPPLDTLAAPPPPPPQEPLSPLAADKKKVFSVKASPICTLCGKTVYKTEEALNSRNAVFHKECLRCASCKASLAGKEPVIVQTGPIRTAQYRIEEGTGNYLCDKHAVSRVNVVQGTSKDIKSRRQSEIDKVEKETHDKNLQVRDSMQYSIGDLTPVCNRCGNALEKNQEIIVSGMERFHAVCPTAEEAAKMIRSVRYFAKKLPERLATTFICDKVTKQPHTFLYELDKDTVTEAMKLKKHETTVIVFKPDSAARASVKRKLQVPGKGNREFELNIRDMDGFTFEDVKGRKGDKPGPMVKPVPKNEDKTLEVVKYKLQNGVLHTITAKYGYDESIEHIEPQTISFKIEMWPPFDPEKEKANDPLATLRSQLRMRETRGESLADEMDTPSEQKGTSASAPPPVAPVVVPPPPASAAASPKIPAVAPKASVSAASKTLAPAAPSASPIVTNQKKQAKSETVETNLSDLLKAPKKEEEPRDEEMDADFRAAAEALSYSVSTDAGSMYTTIGGGPGASKGGGAAQSGGGGGGLFGRMFSGGGGGGKKR